MFDHKSRSHIINPYDKPLSKTILMLSESDLKNQSFFGIFSQTCQVFATKITTLLDR